MYGIEILKKGLASTENPSWMKLLTCTKLQALVNYLFESMNKTSILSMEEYPNFGQYGPILEGFDIDDNLP